MPAQAGVVITQPGAEKQGDQYNTQYSQGFDNPGMALGPIPSGPPQPMGVAVPAGLPPGLAYLANLEEVRIQQILELAEVVLGWEKNNKYNICNSQDQKFMYAKEDTECLTRQCCGIYRPFVMNITDNNEQPLMRLDRPWRCTPSLCWCCHLQEMSIESPPGQLQGTIKQQWTCWIPKYKVYNAQEQVVFTITGECCYCKCGCDVIFRVFEGDADSDSGQEIGQIEKHWGGCSEIFGGVNNFSIKFPQTMDIQKKMLLLGATYLIDFNYFETQK